eukprot:2936258-Ditylum_brightwellii.AAC.1
MKKGHIEYSAEIAEIKKAQIMESKDDVYIYEECGKNGDPKFCNYWFEDNCSGCGTNCKASEQKWVCYDCVGETGWCCWECGYYQNKLAEERVKSGEY